MEHVSRGSVSCPSSAGGPFRAPIRRGGRTMMPRLPYRTRIIHADSLIKRKEVSSFRAGS